MKIRFDAITAVLATSTSLMLTSTAQAAIVAAPITQIAAGATITDIKPIGTHETGEFEKSASEIVAFHAASKRLMVVNAFSGSITVLDASDPTTLTELHTISAGAGTTVNSVAVRKDGLAVATVEPANKTDEGSVIFFDAAGQGEILGTVGVGSLPDMVTISEDGKYALVANEGEPADDYSVDPDGSVSVITLPNAVAAATEVHTASFKAFEGKLPEGVLVFGPEGTDVQNLEPEYISTRNGEAYVTLQENNAVAVIDIASTAVEKLLPLGTVNFSQVPFDFSDKDNKVELRTAPVKGLLLPDAIGTYSVGGQPYFVTANEGDTRDWEGYSEEKRVEKLDLTEGFAGLTAEQNDELQKPENLGRLKVTTTLGKNDAGTYDELYAFGGRGFSIFDAEGNRVFNSDDQFEHILSEIPDVLFNSDHADNKLDDRSDDKGPEPEGLTIGQIGDRTFAFIGLERVSGIMVYDITDPTAAKFEAYINNRDFTADPTTPAAGDLGPEGLTFIPAQDSPNGKPLLAVGNEVSGTTTVYEITAPEAPNKDNGSSEGSTNGSAIGSAVGIFAAILAILGIAGTALQHIPGLQAQVQAVIARAMGK